jgi:hypothetical protein
MDDPLARFLGADVLPGIKTDAQVAKFARESTITRLHLRYTKDSLTDDLVFKQVDPIHGGIPGVTKTETAKTNRFQGRYVMWVEGCGGLGLGNSGFFSAGSPLNKPQSTEKKLVDPIEELIVADLPALDLKARPLRKDAPHLAVNLDSASNFTPPPPAPAPGMTELPLVVDGPLDKEIVRRILRQNRNQMRYCYEKSLQRNPSLAGKVTVEFIVNASGEVPVSKLGASALGDSEAEACMVARAKTWTFPKSASGGLTKVSYPVVFKNQ